MLSEHTMALANVVNDNGIPLTGLLGDLLLLFGSEDRVSSQACYRGKPATGYLTVTFLGEDDSPGGVEMLEKGQLPFLQAALHHTYEAACRGAKRQAFADPNLETVIGDNLCYQIVSVYSAAYSPLAIGMNLHGDHPPKQDAYLINSSLRVILSLNFSGADVIPGTYYQLLGCGVQKTTHVLQGDVVGVSCGSQVKGISIAQHGGRAVSPEELRQVQQQMKKSGEPPLKTSTIMDVRPVAWGKLSPAVQLQQLRLLSSLRLLENQSLGPLPDPGVMGISAAPVDIWKNSVVAHPDDYKQLLFENLHNEAVVKKNTFSERNSRNGRFVGAFIACMVDDGGLLT